uniref:NAD-dependent epimerase/dehydratase domain-containing protein n=1 Tax=Picea sitchensis TaxID=3332 RepID=D5ADN9_PICSI|nr:unknown [Picea sitchensis]
MAAATINGKDCYATTVCVTGATGFVASWLVKRLLEKGYTVHATVRDPENKMKVRHLLDIPKAGEKLKLFRADLIEEGSFDAAINGCDGVFHVASPVDFTPKDPENDVIKPAVDGTLNVLRACTKAKTVKRVVVTSSTASACINESEEQDQYIDETCWTDVDFLRSKEPPAWAYGVAKTLAEQAALQYGKDDAGLDVVTINPVLVVGSAITPNVPYTVGLTLSLLTGNDQSIEALKWIQKIYGAVSLVHVDDVSSAQIFLMENPSAYGRYICSAINISVPQLAHYLSKRYPQYNVTTQFDDVPPIPKVNPSSKKLVDSGFSFKFGIDQIIDEGVEYLKTKGLLD